MARFAWRMRRRWVGRGDTLGCGDGDGVVGVKDGSRWDERGCVGVEQDRR